MGIVEGPFHIKCDFQGSGFFRPFCFAEICTHAYTLAAAKSYALNRGWRYKNGQWLCPSCSASISIKIDPTLLQGQVRLK